MVCRVMLGSMTCVCVCVFTDSYLTTLDHVASYSTVLTTLRIQRETAPQDNLDHYSKLYAGMSYPRNTTVVPGG